MLIEVCIESIVDVQLIGMKEIGDMKGRFSLFLVFNREITY